MTRGYVLQTQGGRMLRADFRNTKTAKLKFCDFEFDAKVFAEKWQANKYLMELRKTRSNAARLDVVAIL